jgi:SAM-dependent methyltransferase
MLDFGCGDGRMTPYFSPQSYVGWDPNTSFVEAAAEANPHYEFAMGEQLPEFDYAFACEVFIHIPDERARSIVAQLCGGHRRLYLIEVMNRKYRSPGAAGSFNRDPRDYAALIPEGFHFEIMHEWVGPHRSLKFSLGRIGC